MKRLLPIAEDLAARLLRTRLDTPFCGHCGTESAAVEELRKVVGNPSLALLFTPLAVVVEREAADALKREQLGFGTVDSIDPLDKGMLSSMMPDPAFVPGEGNPQRDLYAGLAKGLLQADYSVLEERVLACAEALGVDEKVLRLGLDYHKGGLVSPTEQTLETARAALFAPYGGSSFKYAVVDELSEIVRPQASLSEYKQASGRITRHPLVNIKTWRGGCSCSKESPAECQACTEGLIDAIERWFEQGTVVAKDEAQATIVEMGELIDQQAAELKRLKENVNYMTEGCTCERAQGVPLEQV